MFTKKDKSMLSRTQVNKRCSDIESEKKYANLLRLWQHKSVILDLLSPNHDCSRRQILRHLSQFSTKIRYDIT